MTIKVSEISNGIRLAVGGELDHHGARELITRMNDEVDNYMPKSCVLDMSKISFMDSSGIAVVLGLHRRMEESEGSLRVARVPASAMKIFRAAGIDRIVKIEQEDREK